MTLLIDIPGVTVSIDEPNDLVRLLDKTTGSAKAMSLEHFAKLVRLGIRANVGDLP